MQIGVESTLEKYFLTQRSKNSQKLLWPEEKNLKTRPAGRVELETPVVFLVTSTRKLTTD